MWFGRGSLQGFVRNGSDVVEEIATHYCVMLAMTSVEPFIQIQVDRWILRPPQPGPVQGRPAVPRQVREEAAARGKVLCRGVAWLWCRARFFSRRNCAGLFWDPGQSSSRVIADPSVSTTDTDAIHCGHRLHSPPEPPDPSRSGAGAVSVGELTAYIRNGCAWKAAAWGGAGKAAHNPPFPPDFHPSTIAASFTQPYRESRCPTW